jgi:hypothetical protein
MLNLVELVSVYAEVSIPGVPGANQVRVLIPGGFKSPHAPAPAGGTCTVVLRNQ